MTKNNYEILSNIELAEILLKNQAVYPIVELNPEFLPNALIQNFLQNLEEFKILQKNIFNQIGKDRYLKVLTHYLRSLFSQSNNSKNNLINFPENNLNKEFDFNYLNYKILQNYSVEELASAFKNYFKFNTEFKDLDIFLNNFGKDKTLNILNYANYQLNQNDTKILFNFIMNLPKNLDLNNLKKNDLKLISNILYTKMPIKYNIEYGKDDNISIKEKNQFFFNQELNEFIKYQNTLFNAISNQHSWDLIIDDLIEKHKFTKETNEKFKLNNQPNDLNSLDLNLISLNILENKFLQDYNLLKEFNTNILNLKPYDTKNLYKIVIVGFKKEFPNISNENIKNYLPSLGINLEWLDKNTSSNEFINITVPHNLNYILHFKINTQNNLEKPNIQNNSKIPEI